MAYVQFDMQPGKSTSLLNNDSEWNRFVSFDSDNDEELNAYFKRDEFETFVLRTAYEQRRVSFRSIEESKGFKLSLHVSPILTTYSGWAEENEPIIEITAMIISPVPISGANHCAFKYTYYVRSPYEGHIDISSFYQERETNGGQLYKLYSPKRAKELFFSYNPDSFDYVNVRFNEYKYDENFWEGIPHYDFEAEDNSPCLRYEWKVSNFSYVVKDQHICTIT